MVDGNSRVTYFEHVPASPKRDMILLRLGYKKTATILDAPSEKLVDDTIRMGRYLCMVKGAYGRFKIAGIQPSGVELANGIVLQSASLSSFLQNSSELLLMSATSGHDVVERISTEIENGNAATGVILDSVASQTTDAALDWMMDFINNILKKERRQLTVHRYSPGYGDLPLSYQKTIFDLLELQRLGMTITDKYILVPEKSVIAIAGIVGIGEEKA